MKRTFNTMIDHQSNETYSAPPCEFIEQGAGGVGGLLWLDVDGEIYVPSYDHNGNVTRYLDSSGATVAAYSYDAFGNILTATGPLADAFHHRFSTKYYDAEAGLSYYGYRYYSPSLMRWLTRDPIEENGGMNMYLFCNNHSICEIDKLGLFSGFWREPTVLEAARIEESAQNIAFLAEQFANNLTEALGGNLDTIVANNSSRVETYGIGQNLSTVDHRIVTVFNLEADNWPHPRVDKMRDIRDNLLKIAKIRTFKGWRIGIVRTGNLEGLANHLPGNIGLNCSLFDNHGSYSLQNIMAHEASLLFAWTVDDIFVWFDFYSANYAPNYGELLQ